MSALTTNPRDALAEKAAAAWWEHNGSGQAWPSLHEQDVEADWTRKAMRPVVDALLPQVSTVAELEALPDGTFLAHSKGVYLWRAALGLLQQQFGKGYDCNPEQTFDTFGSLTIVWQP